MEEEQKSKVDNGGTQPDHYVYDNLYQYAHIPSSYQSGEYKTTIESSASTKNNESNDSAKEQAEQHESSEHSHEEYMAKAKRIDEMELDEYLEALAKTQEDAAKRIDLVNNSENNGIVKRKLSDMISMLENAGVEFEFRSRVKDKDSTMNKVKKYADEKGILDPEMWDTLGMMVIVEDEQQCRNILGALQHMMEERETCDYIANPKAGYRSIHFYTQLAPMEQIEPGVKHILKALFSKDKKVKDVIQEKTRISQEKELIQETLGNSDFKIPTEIQIKTRAMAVAQSAIHDSIYKRKGITPEKRDQLSSILFPILEKTYDIYRLKPEAQKNGDQDTINKVIALRSEVEELLDNNVEFLSANREIIDETYKTFAIETIKAHNSKSIGVIENAVKKQFQKVNMGYVAITVDTLLEQHFQSESSFPTRYASDSKNDFVRISPDPLINEMIYSASLMDKDELRDIIWKNTKHRIDKVRETFIAAESASQEHHVDEETTKEVQDGVAAIMNEMKSSHPSNEDSHNLQDRLDEKSDVEKGHTNGPKKDIIYLWGNATIEENLRKIDEIVLPTERDKLMTDVVNFSRSVNRQMDDGRIA